MYGAIDNFIYITIKMQYMTCIKKYKSDYIKEHTYAINQHKIKKRLCIKNMTNEKHLKK